MYNIDKTILKFRQEKAKDKINLEDGLYVKDELLRFIRFNLLGNKFSVMLPSTFSIMPLHLAEIKYPSVQRPKEIWSSPDTETNFGISHLDVEVKPEEVIETTKEAKMILQKTNPHMEFYKSGFEELPDCKLAWFDYKSFGIGQDMYNIMFISSVEGKMLHGVFVCLFDELETWSDIALKIVQSIKVA